MLWLIVCTLIWVLKFTKRIKSISRKSIEKYTSSYQDLLQMIIVSFTAGQTALAPAAHFEDVVLYAQAWQLNTAASAGKVEIVMGMNIYY